MALWVALLTRMVALLAIVPGLQCLPTYFLDELCSTTLDMTIQGIEAGRLLLRRPEQGMRFLNCLVFIRAPQGKRIQFRFRQFDVPTTFDCERDFLQLFEDNAMEIQLTGKMCNKGLVTGLYTTNGQEATVRLAKRNYLGDQVELIFTAFRLAPCNNGEFKCHNANCISDSLVCDDYDNCGDGSDMCLLNRGGVIGGIVAAVIVIVAIAIILAVFLYRRLQHRRLEKSSGLWVKNAISSQSDEKENEKKKGVFAAAWNKIAKSSQLSTPSTNSSRLSKDSETKIPGNKESPDSTRNDFGSSVAGNKDALDLKTPHSSESYKSRRNSPKFKEFHFVPFEGPLKSSTMKLNKPGSDSVVYAIPNKKGAKRQSSGTKYPNDDPKLCLAMQNQLLYKNDLSVDDFHNKSFQKNPSFREGMRSDGKGKFPVHVLDPSSLESQNHLQLPNVFDHVVSFRSYSSPPMSVVDGSNPPRLRSESTLTGARKERHDRSMVDRTSVCSSRSSLVKV